MQERERFSIAVLPILGEPSAAIEPSKRALDDRCYNVAKLGFEWSSVIERRGRRWLREATGKSLLAPPNPAAPPNSS